MGLAILCIILFIIGVSDRISCIIVSIMENNVVILPLVFVSGAPRALIATTKNNHPQWAGGNTFKGPTFLSHVYAPMGGWVDALGLKPPL